MGLKVKIVKLLGVREYNKKSTIGQTISMVYLCKPVNGKLRGSKDGRDLRYFNKIPNNTIKEQKEMLYYYFKMKWFLDLIY